MPEDGAPDESREGQPQEAGSQGNRRESEDAGNTGRTEGYKRKAQAGRLAFGRARGGTTGESWKSSQRQPEDEGKAKAGSSTDGTETEDATPGASRESRPTESLRRDRLTLRDCQR
jgi:hypothetical protein